MRHADITEGDRLKLKPKNAYGFGPITVEVIGLKPRDGYAVPWIVGRYGSWNAVGFFKPSDFAQRS